MAEKKKITKKVISKVSSAPVLKETEKEEKIEIDQNTARPKKTCFFCQNKTIPSYSDIVTLKRFTTDRAKIVPKLRSSLCSKHQRFATRQIKYARHLSLLPFTPKV